MEVIFYGIVFIVFFTGLSSHLDDVFGLYFILKLQSHNVVTILPKINALQ